MGVSLSRCLAVALVLAALESRALAGAVGGPYDWEAGEATDRWIDFRGGEPAKVVVCGYFGSFTAKVIDERGRVWACGKADDDERRVELKWTPPARGRFKVITEGSGIKRLITN